MKLSDLSEEYRIWIIKYIMGTEIYYFLWFNNYKDQNTIPLNKKNKKIISILETKNKFIDFDCLKSAILKHSNCNKSDKLKIENFFDKLVLITEWDFSVYDEKPLIDLAMIRNKRKINFRDVGNLISLFDDRKKIPKIKYSELDKILQYNLESIWEKSYLIRQRWIKYINMKLLHKQTMKYLFELTSIWDKQNEISNR